MGTSPTLQQNRLCAWFPGTLEEGVEKDFKCARPMTGRYVFIQMVGVEGALSLCEVQVFSSQGERGGRVRMEICWQICRLRGRSVMLCIQLHTSALRSLGHCDVFVASLGVHAF